MIPIPNSTMVIPDIYVLIATIIISIFSIASNAIGIEAFNKNDSWRKDHKGNFAFLIINLIVSIILLLLSSVALFLNLRK